MKLWIKNRHCSSGKPISESWFHDIHLIYSLYVIKVQIYGHSQLNMIFHHVKLQMVLRPGQERSDPDKSQCEAHRNASFAFVDELIIKLIVIHNFLRASDLTSVSHVESGISEKNRITLLYLITANVNAKDPVHVETLCLHMENRGLLYVLMNDLCR